MTKNLMRNGKVQLFFKKFCISYLTALMVGNQMSLIAYATTSNIELSNEVLSWFNLPNTHGQTLQHLGSYDSGFSSLDGGVAEVVAFNPDNQKMYVVNGLAQLIDIVPLGHLQTGEVNEFEASDRIDIAAIGAKHGFEAYDITSVAINTRLQVIVASVQSYHWMDNGTTVFMDYDGNYIAHFDSGVQPDMIAVSTDGNFVMTADEAEPQSAFTDGSTTGVVLGIGSHGSNANTTNDWNFDYDPKGSVTVVDLTGLTTHDEIKNLMQNSAERVSTVGFEDWDSRLAELIANEVVMKAGNLPSRELEPEYIAFSADGRTAFVALQENNAIAHFDMPTLTFTGIYGIGFIDHGLLGNEINLNMDKIDIHTERGVFGIPQPDGIAAIEINGVQYILTANEGDAREWDFYPDPNLSGGSNRARYRNFRRIDVGDATAVEVHVNEMFYVLNERLDDVFMFGSRSFSIIRASDHTMVFDSGSDFEKITAQTFPTIFNAHHRENVFGVRSARKGPEPESVKALQIGERYFAFIGLERIGGVMMYDITNPAEAFFVDYFNLRNPEVDGVDAGDLGVEGMAVVASEDSPTGLPLVIAANEVSGTVTILEVNLPEEIIEEKPPLLPEDSPSPPFTLEAPTNLLVNEDHVLTWDGIERAVGYRIYVNPIIEVAVTNFNLTNLELEPGHYHLQMRALGNGIESLDSDLSEIAFFVVEGNGELTDNSLPDDSKADRLPQTGSITSKTILLSQTILIAGLIIGFKKK